MNMNNDGLSIWFKDGIKDILLAIDEANLDVVSRFDAPEVRIYRAGFAAAIGAVATAFGLALPVCNSKTLKVNTLRIPGVIDAR